MDKGEDPDDAFSSVPYDKGSNFLLYLERKVGGLDVFLPYIRNYITTFANQSITTDQWRKHLFGFYKDKPDVIEKLEAVKWDAWLSGEGLDLPAEISYDTSLADAAFELADRWNNGRGKERSFKREDLANFNANQVVVFLERLETFEAFGNDDLQAMNDVYGFDTTGSAEVRLRWYNLALKKESGGKFAPSAAKWVRDSIHHYGYMLYALTTLLP